MTITIRITVAEEEYQEAKKEFEEVNEDIKYTKDMFMEDQIEYFYADCHEYVGIADIKCEIK